MSATSGQLGQGQSRKRKSRVYVSGPMRGYNEFNFPMFDYARILGEKLGYEVISPADMDRAEGFDPSKTNVNSFFMQHAVKRDLEAIQSLDPSAGDFVAGLPGYQYSVGAAAEIAVAQWLSIPIRNALSFLDVPPASNLADTFLGTAWEGDVCVPLFLHNNHIDVWTSHCWEVLPKYRVLCVTKDSPAIDVARFLVDYLAKVRTHTPKTLESPETSVGGIGTFEKFLGEKLYGHPRFYEILLDMARLHSRKNHDYAGTEHPLSNFNLTLKMGLSPWKGVVVRLGDKWSRLAAFARSDALAVKDEPIVDTFTDNAVYSILGRILYEELRKETP